MIHELPRRLVCLLLVCAAIAAAHDAPAQVTVQLQLRAGEGQVRVLARIPLEAVRDVDFPVIEGGYLDVERLAPRLPGLAKTWIADGVELYLDGRRLGPAVIEATQLSLPSDRSFASFGQAEARLRSPLPANAEKLAARQLFFDAALRFPLAGDASRLALQPAFAHLGESVHTVVHYRERALLLTEPRVFPLEPTWGAAAWEFIQLGFAHILAGYDHLLFVLCLVIPSRQIRTLIGVVTAFTAAHSLTLIASGLGWAPAALWFPPAVELLIAVSLVYLALANVVGAGQQHSWMLAFAFGLVHGFGFSFALRESLQFAGVHLLTALLAFNIGVELGQLVVLAALVPALHLLFRRVVEERVGRIVLSVLVAHTGWHWMLERAEVLRGFRVTLTAGEAAGLLRGLALALVLAAALGYVRRRRRAE